MKVKSRIRVIKSKDKWDIICAIHMIKGYFIPKIGNLHIETKSKIDSCFIQLKVRGVARVQHRPFRSSGGQGTARVIFTRKQDTCPKQTGSPLWMPCAAPKGVHAASTF